MRLREGGDSYGRKTEGVGSGKENGLGRVGMLQSGSLPEPGFPDHIHRSPPEQELRASSVKELRQEVNYRHPETALLGPRSSVGLMGRGLGELRAPERPRRPLPVWLPCSSDRGRREDRTLCPERSTARDSPATLQPSPLSLPLSRVPFPAPEVDSPQSLREVDP